MKDLSVYLNILLDSINAIEEYSENCNSYQDFALKRIIVDACLMQLIHMGETVKKLKKEFPDFSALPQRQLAGLRDVLAHDYLIVDDELIWEILITHIPKLKIEINSLINEK